MTDTTMIIESVSDSGWWQQQKQEKANRSIGDLCGMLVSKMSGDKGTTALKLLEIT